MLKRPLMAMLAAAIAACVIAGAAWGGTAGWQDIWSQIRPLLSDSGTINNADNPVHWTKLKGVPAGLADGLDNGVDKAGFGLKKNLAPELNLAVDTTKIQRRVTGTCPTGEAVQSIAADGAVTCLATAPAVFFGWKHPADSQPVYATYVTVGGTLAVPAGSWSIVAKVDISQGSNLTAHCLLEARASGRVSVRDEQLVAADAPESGAASVPAVLMGVYSSPSAWHAAVRCRASERPTWWDDIKLIVTRANEIDVAQLAF